MQKCFDTLEVNASNVVVKASCMDQLEDIVVTSKSEIKTEEDECIQMTENARINRNLKDILLKLKDTSKTGTDTEQIDTLKESSNFLREIRSILDKMRWCKYNRVMVKEINEWIDKIRSSYINAERDEIGEFGVLREIMEKNMKKNMKRLSDMVEEVMKLVHSIQDFKDVSEAKKLDLGLTIMIKDIVNCMQDLDGESRTLISSEYVIDYARPTIRNPDLKIGFINLCTKLKQERLFQKMEAKVKLVRNNTCDEQINLEDFMEVSCIRDPTDEERKIFENLYAEICKMNKNNVAKICSALYDCLELVQARAETDSDRPQFYEVLGWLEELQQNVESCWVKE